MDPVDIARACRNASTLEHEGGGVELPTGRGVGGMLGIDLFAGAGGMALGAAWAGVSTKIAVEMHPSVSATYAANHRHTLVIQAKVEDLGALNLPFSADDLILFGGPPCQGFSTSNQRTRNAANAKNWLFRSFVGAVAHLRPAWVIFENVKGILETEKGLFARQIEESIRKLGYDTRAGLLNAAHFGVPQARTRFFLIGRRDGLAPQLPVGRPDQVVTVGDAISDLPELTNGASTDRLPYPRLPASDYAAHMRGDMLQATGHIVSRNADYVIERYGHIPAGGNWEDIPANMMDNYHDSSRCHTGIYHRLRADTPSVVIGNFRKNMLIHPYQDRGLSVREAARLQSFPDDYEFRGSIGLKQQQVGNAVPPLLAQAVFETIMQAHGAV